MAAQKRMLNAVFPSSVYTTAPTPSATPLLGSSSLEGSFHLSQWDSQYDDTSVGDTIRWERTWHNVTAFLALPNQPVTLTDAANTDITANSKWFKKYTSHVPNGISFLVKNKQSRPDGQDDLIQWYFHKVGRHFIDIQLPVILQMLNSRDDVNLLINVLKVLQAAQTVYFYPLDNFVLPILPQDQIELTIWMERYHALVARSLSTSTLPFHFRNCLFQECSTVLGLSVTDRDEDAMEEDSQDPSEAVAARRRIMDILLKMADTGLGGAKTQQQIAEVMSELQTMTVNMTCAGIWKSPSTIPLQLEKWIEGTFAPFVAEVLAALSKADRLKLCPTPPQVFFNQVAWQDRALHDLGALRTKELFDIVIDWDSDTKGAIEDLKPYLKTPRKRMEFTATFSKVLLKRLLQPGASTAEILQVYTRIIRAFAILDPKGVLLDRISGPIVNYLRERDDTVKIVIAGLLGDDKEVSGLSGLVDLVTEAQEASSMSYTEDQSELDYDNMSWVPNPVDAGPNFKSKNSDIMGILIALFDPIDIFLKEFQNVMGDRLLRKESGSDNEFENEIRVLEILKKRFGDASFQACEVMLKDVFDSRRIDAMIRKEQQPHHDVSQEHPTLQIRTRILSRFFWPALLPDVFAVPPVIHSLQARYEKGFESLKHERKLTWLPALGQATVELQLEDRNVLIEEVHTWQASVIYAFQDPNSNSSNPAVRTVEQLVDDLDMDEALVSSALNFWVSKLVLQETSHHTYTVLETLNRTGQGDEDMKQAAAVAAASDAATAEVTNSAIRSDEDVAMEKMNVFWQFIVGMLTNQGAMPLPRIVMMLKFAVPGGFPFSNEELKEYLGRKVQEGEVELAGGVYKRGKKS